MNVRVLVTIGAVLSALVIAGSLIVVGKLFQDINELYSEVLDDIHDFKSLANDAWDEIMSVHTMGKAAQLNGYSLKRSSIFEEMLSRNKRSIRRREANCACAAPPNYCPPGRQGPPGDAGLPGEPGPRGEDGRPGPPGIQLVFGEDSRGGCIKCPIGPPGPLGIDGPTGPEGPAGLPGPAGNAGMPGPPGPPGWPGDMGSEGEPGPMGPPGPSGAPGTHTIRVPGTRGPRGPLGHQGEPGFRGANGPPGAPGPMGPVGPPGRPGPCGPPGLAGPPGERGSPGKDAEYCPCPPRTVNVIQTISHRQGKVAPPSYKRVVAARRHRSRISKAAAKKMVASKRVAAKKTL